MTKTPEHSAAVATLEAVAELCQRRFGERFLAGYAMGSVARGGFSPIVSDVDFGLILKAPLLDGDAAAVHDIGLDARQAKWALAERLSIFWGSPESLKGNERGGRFPPFDRLDLLEHARLIAGDCPLQHVPRPSREELETHGFEFALDYLASRQRIEEFLQPSRIIAKGEVYLSKTVLYPPRFLYSSETGRVAGNDVAVERYLQSHQGADAQLVSHTYDWRERNTPPAQWQPTLELLERGLLPLYRVFLSHYRLRMQCLARDELVRRAHQWWQALGLDHTR